MNLIHMALRRFRQKKLFKQIFDFLRSNYCVTSHRREYEEFLLEFVDTTKAREVKEIKYLDLSNFADYLMDNEPSAHQRDRGTKIVNRFLAWAIRERLIRSMPQASRPDEDKTVAKVKMLTRLTKKKIGSKPNIDLINLVRELYGDGTKTTFKEVAEILTKKFNKKFERQNVWRLYHSARV
jgi:site-specific recombinase XerD